jgi:hypothetical protein
LIRVCQNGLMACPLRSAVRNPPPKVGFFTPSDTDNFLAYELRGLIPKLLHASFCLVVMKTPNPRDLMSPLIGKGKLSMMLKIREPLQWRHSF